MSKKKKEKKLKKFIRKLDIKLSKAPVYMYYLLLVVLVIFSIYAASMYLFGVISLFRVIVYLFSAELLYRLLKIVEKLVEDSIESKV